MIALFLLKIFLQKGFIKDITNYVNREVIKIENFEREIINTKQSICEFANVQIREIMYKIGEYLNSNSDALDILFESLYKLYGNTIIFSRRSLLFSKIFFQKYQTIITLIPNSVTWNQCVSLLRKNNSLPEDIYIFGVIELFSLNGKEIDYFLETENVKFILDDKSVNNIVLEFMNL